VRAATPCFVTVSLAIRVPQGFIVDATEVAAAVSEAVNAVGFTGRLEFSPLVAAAQSFMPPGGSVSPIEMVGTIRGADGSRVQLVSREVLVIPYFPDRLIGGRVVAFFCAPARVSITTEQIAAVQ
jgi:hypothetical protein